MKKALLSFGLLFAFCFPGIAQVDTAAVVREVDSLIQVSRALNRQRNYAEALKINEAAESIALEKLGKETAVYGTACFNHGAILFFKGEYPIAEKWYLESKTIREKVLGKEHPDYAATLNNLAILYKNTGDFKRAEPLYFEAMAIREKALGQEHPDYATSLNNLANLYFETGSYEKAEPLYLEALAIQEKSLGKGHPGYSESLNNLALLYWAARNLSAAELYMQESGEIEKSLLIKATRHLSESELSSFAVKFAEGLNRNFSFAQPQKEFSPTCYDNSLFHKGFLLNAAPQVSKLALAGPVSTEKYNLLKSCHRLLAKQYALPVAERDSALIAELETKANETEKGLARTVAGFGKALRQVTWQEVQAALQAGEAAIEFIHFGYYAPKPTDSTLYAALLLRPGMERPAFIPLFEEKQLEALLAPLAGLGGDGWNELYAGQAGESLYQLLWQPLEVHLDGVKTVYFSPSGLLHRLNLGALPADKNSMLSGRFGLVAMGSTRQLAVDSGQQAAGGTGTAAIFGGIQYEMDSTAITPAEAEALALSYRGPAFIQTDSSLRGGTWKYLKYSDREADNIQSLLQTAGFQAEAHKGYAATEEAFKLLGRGRPSPRILHVSTHGFFFEDPAPPFPPEGEGKGANSPPSGGLGWPEGLSEPPATP